MNKQIVLNHDSQILAGSREQGAGSREQGAGSREQDFTRSEGPPSERQPKAPFPFTRHTT
ncbi:MAG: hypothetical protein U5K72_06670 [Balneolaceae bacterium]|nr:hypothetical protein [Balneolaceae bacterium]